MKELDIRYTEAEDGKVLLEWLKDEKASKWYPPSGEKEANLFAANWINFTKYHSSLTAMLNNKPCAMGILFLMPYKKVAHQCMLYLIVDPKNPKENEIADSLLKNMLNLAKNYFHLEMVVIELFEGAEITSLLAKYDFKEFGIQKNYVKEDGKYSNKILYQHFLR